MFDVISFSDRNNTVFFDKSINKPLEEQQNTDSNGTGKKFYDERKYSLAVLLLAYI